jgi:glycine/D-amino acid oxidase-like deaminating enzyme
MTYQSPIAPGISFYEATLGERPTYDALKAATTADVVIIGGGFTGLQAAYHLAAARQGCGADRRRALRRRRLGAQWRAARHRPARLARGAGGRFRQGAFSRQLFAVAERAKAHLMASPERTASTRTTGRARSRRRTRPNMSKDYRDHVRHHDRGIRIMTHLRFSTARRCPKSSDRHAITAAPMMRAPATSIRSNMWSGWRARHQGGRTAAREHPGAGDQKRRRQGDGEDRCWVTSRPARR